MILSKFTRVLPGLMLAACSVGPDFHRPDNHLPASWSHTPQSVATATDPAALAHWWRRFHDPALTALVEQAVTVNLDVQQAAARLSQARAQRQAAASSLFPWLAASGREQDTHVDGSGPAAGHSRSYQGGLSASWEIDVFGGTRRNVESSTARLAAAAADLDATRLSMAAEVALTYCQLRAIQDELAVARRNLVTQEHSANITQERRSAGFASALDVANSTAQVANTQAQIPGLETAAMQSIHAISVLLNRPPTELTPLLAPSRPVPTASATVPNGIPSDVLRRRPDVVRAEANAHAATANIGVAVADLFPKFSLNGSLTQQSANLADWLSPTARVASWGPAFNWALIQGGNLKANILIQQALRDQAVLAYRKTVLVALQEVEDALTASTNERRRHASLTEAVTANRRAVELSLDLYTAGQTEFINVLNAQRSLFQSETEFTLSNLALARELISLYKALGGGW